MFTHVPTAAEVVKYRELLGLYEVDLALNPWEKVKAELIKGSGRAKMVFGNSMARIASTMVASVQVLRG